MSLLFNFEEIGIHEQVANADYEYLLDLNQVNSLWRLWKGNSVFVVNNSEL